MPSKQHYTLINSAYINPFKHCYIYGRAILARCQKGPPWATSHLPAVLLRSPCGPPAVPLRSSCGPPAGSQRYTSGHGLRNLLYGSQCARSWEFENPNDKSFGNYVRSPNPNEHRIKHAMKEAMEPRRKREILNAFENRL